MRGLNLEFTFVVPQGNEHPTPLTGDPASQLGRRGGLLLGLPKVVELLAARCERVGKDPTVRHSDHSSRRLFPVDQLPPGESRALADAANECASSPTSPRDDAPIK